VILAGGKSSRFGRDKFQMELAGTKIVDHLLQILSHFRFRQLAVSTAYGKGEKWREGVVTLPDDQESLGPMGGIATALRRLPGGIFVTACDMPFVSIPLVEWLLDCYDPRAGAVIPRHPGGIEPLLGIYEKGILPLLEEAIRREEYALHGILKRAEVRYVDVPKEFSVELEFSNVNTPEDYERVVKLLSMDH
jgi:molybdopterin-guanine dinucleotide biosynthesis protein A